MASWRTNALNGLESASLGNDQEASNADIPARYSRSLRSHFQTSSFLVVTVGSDLAVHSGVNANAARAILH